jgi:hypothetical protein
MNDREAGHTDADADERAIARALHSDDDASTEPTDDALVADYEEVLARLGGTDREPPAEMEERVVRAALAARPAAIRSIDATRRHRRRRQRTERSGRRRFAIVATAAAVAAGVAIVSLAQDDGSEDVEAALVGNAAPAELDALLEDPRSRQAELRDAAGAPVASIVFGPADEAGATEGFLYDVELPPAPADRTYWLWVTTPAGPVAVGDIGTNPASERFLVSGEVDGASVSVEARTDEPTAPGTTVAST